MLEIGKIAIMDHQEPSIPGYSGLRDVLEEFKRPRTRPPRNMVMRNVRTIK